MTSYLPAPDDVVRTVQFEFQDFRGVHTRTRVGLVKGVMSKSNGLVVWFKDGRRSDLDYSNGFDSVKELSSEEYTRRCDFQAWSDKLLQESPESIRDSSAIRAAAEILQKASGIKD